MNQKPEQGNVKKEFYKLVNDFLIDDFGFDEKYLELAQKGFDYDFKVGPHARIAKLLESDPKIATIVNEYVQGQISETKKKEEPEKKPEFSIKPLEEYENADAWLKDNIKTFSEQQVVVPPAPQKPTQKDVAQQVETSLKMRDPHGFAKVYPEMIAQIPNLTIAQYQAIDADVAELFKFYDAVRENVMKKDDGAPPPGKTTEVPSPSFKVSSGKTTAEPVNKKTPEYVWNLPNNKFDQVINRAKGFI